MKITDGFDKRHFVPYFVLLVAISFASALILIAAIFMSDNGQIVNRNSTILYSFTSLVISTSCYMLLRKFKRSFFLVGVSGVAFSLALHGFGVPSAIPLILAGASAAIGIGSVIFGDAVDRQVSSEE